MIFNKLAHYLIESHSVSVSSQTNEGTIQFFKDGKLHRDNGPAVIAPDGTLVWWHEGNPHREDGPAAIWYGDLNNVDYYLFGKKVAKQQIDEFQKKKKLQQNLQTKDNNMFDAVFIGEM